MSEHEKLLPCPFCGGKDLEVHRAPKPSQPDRIAVRCGSCGIQRKFHMWWTITEWNTRATIPAPLRCEDCGLPYIQFPLDAVLPDEQWEAITGRRGPDAVGILCAQCILRRGSKLAGVTVAFIHFPELGPPRPYVVTPPPRQGCGKPEEMT